jgi:DNA-directed RNA polymerase specialized sigma subunit
VSDKEFLILLSYLPYAKVRLATNMVSKQLGYINNEDEQKILFYRNMINKFDIAINTLTQYEKKLLFLRVFDGMTYNEISIRLGYASHSSVIRIMNEIIHKIKEAYENEI